MQTRIHRGGDLHTGICLLQDQFCQASVRQWLDCQGVTIHTEHSPCSARSVCTAIAVLQPVWSVWQQAGTTDGQQIISIWWRPAWMAASTK